VIFLYFDVKIWQQESEAGSLVGEFNIWRAMNRICMSPTNEGWLKLIGQAYECVEDGHLWQSFLESYAALVKATCAILIAYEGATGSERVLADREIDGAYQAKHSEYASRNPYIQRAREQLVEPFGIVLPGHAICRRLSWNKPTIIRTIRRASEHDDLQKATGSRTVGTASN
jgi:hypothetical protein